MVKNNYRHEKDLEKVDMEEKLVPIGHSFYVAHQKVNKL